MKLPKLCYLCCLLWLSLFSGTVSAQQSSDSLQHYLQVAALNNAGVQADLLAYKASLQKLPQAGAYQDLQFEVGAFTKPMAILGGREVAQFKLMQMFPWFGTKRAARTEAMYRAEVALERYNASRDELFLSVCTRWYALCSLQQQLADARADKALFTALEELATRRMEAGKAMSDVLRIRLEALAADNRIAATLSAIEAGKAQFNALLNRDVNTSVLLPDTLLQTHFTPDHTGLLTQVEERSPLLKSISHDREAYRARAALDRRKSLPMLGIGVQYMLNQRIDNPAFGMGSMNGRDMVMPMLSFTIPIYRNKYNAQQRENRLWQQVDEAKYTETLRTLQASLVQTLHRLDDAARLITLYHKQGELAETTYRLVLQEYVGGRNELTNVLQVQRQLLDYRLKAAEATADYNTQVAQIRKLMSYDYDINP
jgi:outer membrane protein TolC